MINKIESGGALPATETFLALADALNLSPLVLFKQAGLMPASHLTDEEVENLEYKISRLSPARRAIALRLLDALLTEDQPELPTVGVTRGEVNT